MSKFSREDYIKYFELGTSTDGYSDDFEKLEKQLFGSWVPPDVSQAFNVYKKKSDGSKLFADYMIIHRPKGKLMSPQGGWDRKGKEMEKKSGKLKEMVQRIIKEESSNLMQDGDVEEILKKDLDKELKQCYDYIEYLKKQISSIIAPRDQWAKKEYMILIKSKKERMKQIVQQLQHIKNLADK